MPRKQPPAALARQASQAALASGGALGGALGLRERMLELAGVTEAEQARLTRCSINKLTDLLAAKRVTRLVVNAGRHVSEVREYVDEDTGRQHAAATELLDRFGVVVSKQTNALNVGGNLTVVISKQQPPDVLDAEPADLVLPAEVQPNPAS